MGMARDFGIVALVVGAVVGGGLLSRSWPGSRAEAPPPSAAAPSLPVIEISGTAVDQATVRKAVATLFDACGPLRWHREDISRVRVTTRIETADHRLARGWKKSIEIAIPLPENPVSLPSSDPEVGAVAGHTLFYDVGGGPTPGLLASKRISQKLCHFAVSNSGASLFRAYPAFSFITY